MNLQYTKIRVPKVVMVHEYLLIAVRRRECDGLLSVVWIDIDTVQHSEELICNIFRCWKGREVLQFNFEELIHTLNAIYLF